MVTSLAKSLDPRAWSKSNRVRGVGSVLLLVACSCLSFNKASAQATAPAAAYEANATPRWETLEISSEDQDPAFSEMWSAVTNCGEVSVSRTKLLEQFQAIVTKHPDSKYRGKAEYASGILTKMITEDEAHAKISPTDFGRLSVEERVRELVFQLRNQNHIPKSFLPDPKGATNTEPYQLAAIGYTAVPQLLAAVDDASLTRSVWITHLRRRSSFPEDSFEYDVCEVATIGDAATAVLESIAGRSFRRTTPLETHRAAEAWWTVFQEKGEEQTLTEGTEAGNDDSLTQARFLLDRYPAAALAALIKGTRAATNQFTRMDLLKLFERFDSSSASEFLLQEVREGVGSSPLFAAKILNHKGKPEGVATLIQEWEETGRDWPEKPEGTPGLVFFLASVDSSDAVAALGKNYRSRPLEARIALVKSVGQGGSSSYRYGPATNRSAATQAAVEEFLVTALDDTGQDFNQAGRMNRVYIDPRICDIAGLSLNDFWPQRYNFDIYASLKVRDAQRVECQNVWRKSRGLLLLALPAPGQHVSTNEAVNVTAIEWGADSVKPPDSFAAKIEAFRNKPLESAHLVDLLTAFSGDPGPGITGLILQLRKDEDLTGVKFSISLFPGTPQDPRKTRWDFKEGAVIGQKPVDQRGGGITPAQKRQWDFLATDIDKSLASSPETPFVIDLKLVLIVR